MTNDQAPMTKKSAVAKASAVARAMADGSAGKRGGRGGVPYDERWKGGGFGWVHNMFGVVHGRRRV